MTRTKPSRKRPKTGMPERKKVRMMTRTKMRMVTRTRRLIHWIPSSKSVNRVRSVQRA